MKKIYWQVQQINRIGGAEMVSIDLANHLSDDYDITLISTVEFDKDTIPYYIDPKVKVISMGVPKRVERIDVLTKKYLKHFRIFSLIGLYCQFFYHYFLKIGGYRKKIEEMILENDATLICSAVDSYRMAPKKGRVFFHFHFDGPTFFRFDNYPVFKVSRKPDKWIFLTKTARNDVIKKVSKIEENSVYIYNPSRLERVLDTEYHDNTIIFAGRFNTQKNPMLALAVAKSLKDRDFPFKLKMFGDPVMKKKMDAYIEENHLGDVVELYPPSNDIKKEMLQADILLMTSVYEGLPLVLLEANALSRPFVLSRWGEVVDELFPDDSAGIVVDGWDAEIYADKIIELLSDKEKLKKAKQSAYESAERFTHKRIIPEWKKMLG